MAMPAQKRKLFGKLIEDEEENLFFINEQEDKIEWLGLIWDNHTEDSVICYNAAENFYSLVKIINEPLRVRDIKDIISIYPNADLPREWEDE